MCSVCSDDRRRSRSPRRRSNSRSESRDRSPRRRRHSPSRDRHSRHQSRSQSPSSSTLERTLRIRGLPFGATTDDVTEFFRPLRLSSSSPVLCVPLEQRPPGEAYVRFKSREDAERGMRRHRAMMQRRFIEVFHVVDQKEIDDAKAVWCTLEEASDRLNIDTTWEQEWKEEDGYVVRLRGLPWESSLSDLRQFFSPLQLDEADVDIVLDATGRPSGEAYVRLRDRDAMQMALNRNRKTMGKRYIEVYKSTLNEFSHPDQRKELERKPIPAAAGPQGGFRDVRESRPPPFAASAHSAGRGGHGGYGGRNAPPAAAGAIQSRLAGAEQGARDGFVSFYGRDGRDGSGRKGARGLPHVVRIRGLSFTTTEQDVYNFFGNLHISALHIIVDAMGRPSGDAYIELETSDDEAAAIARHRQTMGRRYIEVFACSPADLDQRLKAGPGAPPPPPPHMAGGGYRGGPPMRGGPPPPRGMGGYGGPPGAVPFAPSGFGGPPPQVGGEDVSMSTCLKARGIPWEATEEDVLKFFQQCGFSPVSLHRQQGEAYVEFSRPEHCTAAMQLHRSLIGTRYIELQRCTYNEMARVVGLPLKPDGAGAEADGYGAAAAYGAPGGYGGYGGNGVGVGMGAGGYGYGGGGGGYEMQGGYGQPFGGAPYGQRW